MDEEYTAWKVRASKHARPDLEPHSGKMLTLRAIGRMLRVHSTAICLLEQAVIPALLNICLGYFGNHSIFIVAFSARLWATFVMRSRNCLDFL